MAAPTNICATTNSTQTISSQTGKATGKVPFRQNQYGVAVGGPVVIPKIYHGRDKTFWFFNWEGFRERQGQTNISSYPYAGRTKRRLFSSGFKTIYDPSNRRIAGPDGKSVIRQPFPGNIIPHNRISPAMTFLVEYHGSAAEQTRANPKFRQHSGSSQ